MKIKKIHGDGREEIVESKINRKLLAGLNCGTCAGVRCNTHKCPHNLGLGEPCDMDKFVKAGGRLEEAPAPMIAPKVGDEVGLVIVDRVPVLLFATVSKEELAEFSMNKRVVSASVDVGSGNVTVFYWSISYGQSI